LLEGSEDLLPCLALDCDDEGEAESFLVVVVQFSKPLEL
jgi:hypothetical protein